MPIELNPFTKAKINYDIVVVKTPDGTIITKKVLYNKAGEEQIFSTTIEKAQDYDNVILDLQNKIAEITAKKTMIENLKPAELVNPEKEFNVLTNPLKTDILDV